MRERILRISSTSALPAVTAGDLFALGRHRLLCGDAQNPDDVAKLLNGERPSLVVTSPPYGNQRDYDRPISCWDSMMLAAFNGHKFAEDVQVLVNLGIYHRQGEALRYWDRWVSSMRAHKWLYHAEYVWRKTVGLPHAVQTRLTPKHEYVFHFTKTPKKCVAWVANKSAGDSAMTHKSRQRTASGKKAKQRKQWQTVAKQRIHESVISTSILHPSEATGHPAQFPIALPSVLIKSFVRPGESVYDPFCGSGTTLLACEQEDINGFAMEISPSYVKLALERWRKLYPHQSIKRLNR